MKKIMTLLVATIAFIVYGATESSASTYTVEKGDTLSEIASQYKVSLSNLQDWNNLKTTVILPNQKIKIANDQVVKMYKVKKGDSLYKISKEHNVSVSNLKKWNQLSTTIIHPNQKLQVESLETMNDGSKLTNDQVEKEFTVSATAYTANCNGCSGITKTGINLKRNPGLKVIAVDPNVIELGTKVYVEGYGYAVAGDVGGAIKGNKIDVFIPKKSDAYKWGRKDVKLKILK